MGVRLQVEDAIDKSLEFYGTKLYGYTKDEGLRSAEYLKRFQPDFEPYLAEYKPDIQLSAEEFREFIRLYEEDFRERCDIELFEYSGHAELEALFNNDHPKIVSWL